MYADYEYRSNGPAGMRRTSGVAAPFEREKNCDFVLRMVVSVMPLTGLILGVVALTLWNAG